MANVYEDLEKQFSTNPPNTSGNTYQQLEEDFARKSEQPKPTAPANHNKLDAFLRSFNDTLTFGLWDKAVGAVRGRDEASITEARKKDHPYISTGGSVAGGVLPAMGMSAALAKVIPGLSKFTVPRVMAREGLSGGALSVVDDVARGKDVDAGKAAVSAGTSGATAGLLSSVASVLSPSTRFRMSGRDLTPVDKANMSDLSRKANALKIPLTVSEAAENVAPGRAARVSAEYNSNTVLPEGSVARSNFNTSREPKMAVAAEAVRKVIGGGPATGVRAGQAAEGAIKSAEDLISNSSKPFYEAAENVTVRGVPRTPSIVEARTEVNKDPVLRGFLKDTSPKSIRSLDITKKQMDSNYKMAEGDASPRAPIIAKDVARLREAMDQASPDYAVARQIEGDGENMLIDRLRAGPLGSIAQNKADPFAQSKALFDVVNRSGADESINAAKRLAAVDPQVPAGLLASRVDDAALNPMDFGRRIAPNPEAERVVREVAGPKFDTVEDIINVSKAVDPTRTVPRAMENSDGYFSWLFNKGQNVGSGRLAEMFHDPANIEKLGRMGPVQGLLTSGGTSVGVNTAENVANNLIPEEIRKKRRRVKIKLDSDPNGEFY